MKFISFILFLTMPIVTHAFAPIVGGDCGEYYDRNCGIKQAVDAYLDTATNRAAVLVKYGPIEDWDTSLVTDMSRLFQYTSEYPTKQHFNVNITAWDTSAVTNMNRMFWGTPFNQPLNWNTSQVTNMQYMFIYASAFNQPLNWNTRAVTDMQYMFYNAPAFNQPLNLKTNSVTDMQYMFSWATAFNQDISSWDTGAVTSMNNSKLFRCFEKCFFSHTSFFQCFTRQPCSTATSPPGRPGQ